MNETNGENKIASRVVSKYEVVGCSISVGKMKPKPMLSNNECPKTYNPPKPAIMMVITHIMKVKKMYW